MVNRGVDVELDPYDGKIYIYKLLIIYKNN